MKREIYDSRFIRWFASRIDTNGKISAIAVPFILNKDSTKIKNLINGKVYEIKDYYLDQGKIKADLNVEYNRNSFRWDGDIKSVISDIKISLILNFMLFGGDECVYKDYYTKSGIMKLTKLYEKALNKFEKIDQKEAERKARSLETREF